MGNVPIHGRLSFPGPLDVPVVAIAQVRRQAQMNCLESVAVACPRRLVCNCGRLVQQLTVVRRRARPSLRSHIHRLRILVSPGLRVAC